MSSLYSLSCTNGREVMRYFSQFDTSNVQTPCRDEINVRARMLHGSQTQPEQVFVDTKHESFSNTISYFSISHAFMDMEVDKHALELLRSILSLQMLIVNPDVPHFSFAVGLDDTGNRMTQNLTNPHGIHVCSVPILEWHIHHTHTRHDRATQRPKSVYKCAKYIIELKSFRSCEENVSVCGRWNGVSKFQLLIQQILCPVMFVIANIDRWW